MPASSKPSSASASPSSPGTASSAPNETDEALLLTAAGSLPPIASLSAAAPAATLMELSAGIGKVTVQVNVAPGNSIEVMGRRYELAQFHFHRPSEERIDGRQFDMVVHLVHKDPEGRLAVVAVLLERGSAQPVVQKIWNNLPLEKGEEVGARAVIDLNHLLPAEAFGTASASWPLTSTMTVSSTSSLTTKTPLPSALTADSLSRTFWIRSFFILIPMPTGWR